MGNSRPGHFNAQFKDTFGWLPGGTVKVHGGGSATYTLGPLEATGQSTYAVKIPTTGTSPVRAYWVEFRGRTGFDAGEPATIVNGDLIRIAPSSGADLLDMTPATSTFDDAQLDAPLAFNDPQVNLTITTLSKTATSLTIRVDYGAPPPATAFHTLAPCRVFDTRNPNGTYGGPALFAGQTRSWVVRGRCGVPATAKSIAAISASPPPRLRTRCGRARRDDGDRDDDRELSRRPDARERRRGRARDERRRARGRAPLGNRARHPYVVGWYE